MLRNKWYIETIETRGGILNEVLSLNAQEFDALVEDFDRRVPQ